MEPFCFVGLEMMGKEDVRRRRTGSTPTMMQAELWVFLSARATPETVPPVPAPPTKTSTLPEEGCVDVDGVDVTASMISGPVVSSCASGLFTLRHERHNKISMN